MNMSRRARKKILMWIAFLIAAGTLFFYLTQRQRQGSSGIYSEKQVETAEIAAELNFGSYSGEDWEGWLSENSGAYLTKTGLRSLLEKLGLSEYIQMPQGVGMRVGRAQWNEVYGQILDYLDMEAQVERGTFLVLDTMEGKEQNVLITNRGDYDTRLPLTYFEKWAAYEVYETEGACLGIVSVSGGEETIPNVYLKEAEEDGIEFLYGGASYRKELTAEVSDVAPGVCDIILKEREIVALRLKQEAITGGLLSYDEETIEIEAYGKISHTGDIPVYQTYGEVTEKSLSDVILGNMEVEYITGDGEVCAVLIRQPASIENIRVLLLAEGEKFRQEVFLKSDAEMQLTCGDRKETISPGTVINAADYEETPADGKAGPKTLVLSRGENEGVIYICSADGTPVSAGYAGTMEVRRRAEGYTLVNELPLEQYLAAVVPSEMPSSYAPEALKAQAVCARSYAYIQLLRADLAKYGAHIDDSTSYQVYNKTGATEESRAAVYDTAGQVLTYGGEIIEAYYFSTSMGYTDTAQIWNVDDDGAYGYLKAACLNAEACEGDLSVEEDFRAYIGSPAEGYDSDIKYYRWFAAADYRDKTETLNRILAERHAVSPQNICYYKKDGKTEAESPEKLGKLTGLAARERSASGCILTLQLDYENGMVLVKTEYNIRMLLGALVEKIVYADASESADITLLPSAFCAVTPQEDGTLLLQGGGYGHGLGMSQNAANGMAKAGMTYDAILQYFYNDVAIENLSSTESK